jgi:signal transduction histidine kinase
LRSYRWALEPAAALALFLGWLIASAFDPYAGVVTMVVLCGAVAVSRVAPAVALAITWCAVLAQVAGLYALPSDGAWPGYLACLLIVVGVSAHGEPWLQWLALASAVGIGVLAGLVATRTAVLELPSEGLLGDLVRPALTVGVMIVGLVAAWLGGFLLARQRSLDAGQTDSIIVWLAARERSASATSSRDDDWGGSVVRSVPASYTVVDAVGAVAYAVICLVSGAVSSHGAIGAVLLYGAAILLRRLSPTVALVLAWLGAIVHMLSGGAADAADLAVLVVLYATSAYGDRITRWSGLGSAAVGGVIATAYLAATAMSWKTAALGDPQLIASLLLRVLAVLLLSLTVLGLAWVLGLLARTARRAHASRQALGVAEAGREEARLDAAAEHERARIARDMHDVVAHSLAVVIAQADGARYLRQTDPAAVDTALDTIASTARQALGDVRVLLSELRHDEASLPRTGPGELDELVEGMRSAGLDVTVTENGERIELSAATGIALYRITQEALTNALRHGSHARVASVDLDWRSTELTLTVRNPASQTRQEALRIGHGLAGMRERATLCGGRFEYEDTRDGFVVRTILPARGRSGEGSER